MFGCNHSPSACSLWVLVLPSGTTKSKFSDLGQPLVGLNTKTVSLCLAVLYGIWDPASCSHSGYPLAWPCSSWVREPIAECSKWEASDRSWVRPFFKKTDDYFGSFWHPCHMKTLYQAKCFVEVSMLLLSQTCPRPLHRHLHTDNYVRDLGGAHLSLCI